jgi:hypothetical protein
MQRIKDFITRLTTEGVQVIVITDIPDQFEGNEKVFVVRDWNDSWQMVNIKVGSNRRILQFDDLSKKNLDLDGLEAYAQAGILEDGMFWIKSLNDNLPHRDMQEFVDQIKHLVIILGGLDFYTSIESLKRKFPELLHQEFIISPLSEKKNSDGKFFYRPKELTVIFEWPRMIDRLAI